MLPIEADERVRGCISSMLGWIGITLTKSGKLDRIGTLVPMRLRKIHRLCTMCEITNELVLRILKWFRLCKITNKLIFCISMQFGLRTICKIANEFVLCIFGVVQIVGYV